jgi:hypothetical protein
MGEITDYDRLRKEQAEQFRKAFADVIELGVKLNIGEAAEQIVSAIIHNHRTHQQMFMGAIKLAILKYSRTDCDLRNEAAVQWAGKVADLPDSDLRFPYF